VSLNIGLLNNVDLQLVLQTYSHVRVKDRNSGTVRVMQGFGDIIPRLKVNLWGNDGGPTALAVMPFVKLPTNQDDLGNNSVEGGVIFPWVVALPRGWSMGSINEVDFNRDE